MFNVIVGAEKTLIEGQSKISIIVFLLIAGTSSMFFARQLHLEGEFFVWLVLFAAGFLAMVKLDFAKFRRHRVIFASACIFVALFDLSLVLGDHIVVAAAYDGLIDDNYIVPYGKADFLKYLAVLPVLLAMVLAPLQIILEKKKSFGANLHWRDRASLPLGIRPVMFLMMMILIAWLPYLVVYWPGFIFGDSLDSLSQALGFSSLNNHHPVAYTLFLKICLKLGWLFGANNTVGVAISSLIQGFVMAFVFAYMARWVSVRANAPFFVSVIIALIFGLSSYIATYSVALWKDPLFSACVVSFTLCLADLIWSEGLVSRKPSWVILFLLSSLGMVLLRNNGVFLFLISFAAIVLLSVIRKGLRKYSLSLLCLVLVGTTFGVVTGPVFKAIGVMPTEKSESVGVPLNQMARVAALGGEMTNSDKEYLDKIIPLDEYRQSYFPCCTDNLKWSPNFSNEALGDGMWSHWVSMLEKNPNVYFQAWELQTFGFWAVNTEEQASNVGLSGWSWNVSGGVPRNTSLAYVDDLDSFDISSNPAALNENVVSVVPHDSWSVPISWLLWLCLYLLLCLCAADFAKWSICLLPSLALVGTLVVASPIWYWPRYGAALQFLIPVYALLFLLVFRCEPKGAPLENAID